MAGKQPPKLTEEGRAFVVAQLAAFDPPSVVVQAVREEFGVDITPQTVESYDPTKRAGAKLQKKWRDLFFETRKAFIEGKAEIGIAHKTVRLRALERLIRRTEKGGNVSLTAQLLEQAAKESGDAYTNRHRHELTGKNGGPIESRQKLDMSELSAAERAALKPVLTRIAGAGDE